MNPKFIGSSFDSFLKEEGLLKQVREISIKRAKAFHEDKERWIKDPEFRKQYEAEGRKLLRLLEREERPYRKAREIFHTSASHMKYDLGEWFDKFQEGSISSGKLCEVIMVYLLKAMRRRK